jgi:hypothetical protein
MNSAMTQTATRQSAVEHAFRLLAKSLDQVGEEKAEVFLAKIVLILANTVNDPVILEDAVRRAVPLPE